MVITGKITGNTDAQFPLPGNGARGPVATVAAVVAVVAAAVVAAPAAVIAAVVAAVVAVA